MASKLTQKELDDPTIPKVENFTTIDPFDILAAARNRLRGLETDKVNVMIVAEPGREERLIWFDEQITNLRDVIIPALEKQTPDAPVEGSV